MKIIMSIPMQECPHCHKIIGNAVVRTFAKIQGDILIGQSKLECCRSECAKLIGILRNGIIEKL